DRWRVDERAVAKNRQRALPADIDFSVGDRGHGELDRAGGRIARAGLTAVVNLQRDVRGVVGVENRRATAGPRVVLQRPDDGVVRAVGGNARRRSRKAISRLPLAY